MERRIKEKTTVACSILDFIKKKQNYMKFKDAVKKSRSKR